ncbi:MAG: response regulator [Candidatus Hydrothermales bacterium]
MKRVKILVVEDEGPLSFFITQSLKEEHDVVWARSGEEALEKFVPGEFDIIITDIKLPGISGLELLSKIQMHDPNIKSIVITAYDSFETREKVKNINADFFLPKPFTVQTLKEAIRKLMKKES